MSIAAGSSHGKASSDPLAEQDSCLVSSESVQLGTLWQRLHDNRWIVGLSMHNRTARFADLLLICRMAQLDVQNSLTAITYIKLCYWPPALNKYLPFFGHAPNE